MIMIRNNKLQNIFLFLSLGVFLTACGGGEDEPNPDQTRIVVGTYKGSLTITNTTTGLNSVSPDEQVDVIRLNNSQVQVIASSSGKATSFIATVTLENTSGSSDGNGFLTVQDANGVSGLPFATGAVSSGEYSKDGRDGRLTYKIRVEANNEITEEFFTATLQ